jgi:phage anti-repressor protein
MAAKKKDVKKINVPKSKKVPIQSKNSKKKSKISTKKTKKQFYLVDGRALSSLLDLADAFHDMPNEVFTYHVSDDKNDFSSWIRDVYNEIELAESLLDSMDRKDHQVKVLRFVVKDLR